MNPHKYNAFDRQLLVVADRLFHELDELPVIDIVHALCDARRELRAAGVTPAPPELIGARARGLLLGIRAA